MVPLVSSSTMGPLGAVHLPRMWVKALLSGLGALPSGYWFATKGFDGVVLGAFGVDPAEFVAYVTAEHPDYPALEQWFAGRIRSRTDAIAALNAQILGQQKPLERAAEHHALLGCDAVIRGGVLLNDLDDWHGLHAAITSGGPDTRGIVPAISSSTVGPLGAAHLPRLWLTAVLQATGRLADGYAAGVLDELTLAQLGIDAGASAVYLASAVPNYVAYERWVREHARHADAAGIAAANLALHAHRDQIARTDLQDWRALYNGYLAAA